MTPQKPDTSRGFNPPQDFGADTVRPAFECLRLDGALTTRLRSPAVHQILLGVARLRNAVSSLKLEGEPIALEEARRTMELGSAETPAQEGLLRMSRAYGELAASDQFELSVDRVLAMHKRLFTGVLEEGKKVGEFKREQNSIIDLRSGRPSFLPTPPERVVPELEALLAWYTGPAVLWPPPIASAVFFAEFQAIHPFDDGNGRLGRFLNVAVLKNLGCRNAPLVPLDTRFFRTSDRYYEMLASTNSGRTYRLWSRYYVDQLRSAYGLAASRADLRPLVERFSKESTRKLLTWILIGEGLWFGAGDYPNPSDYTQPAIWGSLMELVRAGVLEKRGERRGRRYRLKTSFLKDVYERRTKRSVRE
jgi:Fic family protein